MFSFSGKFEHCSLSLSLSLFHSRSPLILSFNKVTSKNLFFFPLPSLSLSLFPFNLNAQNKCGIFTYANYIISSFFFLFFFFFSIFHIHTYIHLARVIIIVTKIVVVSKFRFVFVIRLIVEKLIAITFELSVSCL